MKGSHRLVRQLPVLLIVVGVVIVITTPPRFTAIPLFAAAPLVAAPFYSFKGTLWTGVTSTLAVAALHAQERTVDEVQAYTEEFTLLTVSALALAINVTMRHGGEQLASAREIAQAAQRAVLPSPAKEVDDLLVAARYQAAVTDALVGGDFFAVQNTPCGARAVVGDVRGKGLGAVGMVAVAVGTFREASEREDRLEAVADWLDGALAREAERQCGEEADESFATAVLAEIPHRGGVVRLINRGHPAPLLLTPGGDPESLPPDGYALPLGMSGVVGEPFQAQEYVIPRNATLLLYTDGLTEARDANGVFYDPAVELVGRTFSDPDLLLDWVVNDVLRHTGGHVTDDMALLALTYVAPSADGNGRHDGHNGRGSV
ncbi:PP2C family protein-serine/threonine phosphatase [Streptomyces sp. NPDC056500]|uniref:PP2C family protein-serine/threonine phosphatase n=1 Tax=Streptomyces sp. NPDC056500 TaxID=3345840 RepID=UPI003691388E